MYLVVILKRDINYLTIKNSIMKTFKTFFLITNANQGLNC